MGEIVAKFGSAMSGFWWALDEQERRIVIVGAVWLAAFLATYPLERRATRRWIEQREEITAQVIAELSGGGRG